MAAVFRTRIDAASMLAGNLTHFAATDPIILGMARGGVVIAAEIARRLNADFDVLVVRKIGAPGNPEYGVGAVAPNGLTVFDNAALASLKLRASDLDATVKAESAEITRRLELYRRGMSDLDLTNRTAILVDDGLATGITAIAAARYAKSLGANRIIFAAPVCSRPGALTLKDEVDEIVCLESPEVFFAVGTWYEDFTQVEDAEVLRAMSGPRNKQYLA